MASKSLGIMDLRGFVKAEGGPHDQITITMTGHNSTFSDTQIKVYVNAWQISDLMKQVVKIQRERIKHEMNTLEDLKTSTE